MTISKARMIGIIYTFLLATIQAIGVAFFLFWIGDLEYSRFNSSEVLYFFLDRGIAIIFLATLFYARHLGTVLLLNQGKTKKTSNILIKIGVSATTLTFLWYLLLHSDYSNFDIERLLIALGFIALLILFLYLAYILPSLYLADKLEWLIKRHRSKNP